MKGNYNKKLGFLIISLNLFLVLSHSYNGAKEIGVTTGEFIYVKDSKREAPDDVYPKIYFEHFPPVVIRVYGLGDVSLVASQYHIGYISSVVLKAIWRLTHDLLYLRFFNLITFAICSLIVYLLLSKTFDFWTSVIGTISFQIHISFISYIYEMNPMILSFCAFFMSLLSNDIRTRILFMILSLHLNTSWFILFFVILYIVGRRYFAGIDRKAINPFNVCFFTILVFIPLLIFFMHPNLMEMYSDQVGNRSDTLAQKLKGFIYLFTFPHVIFFNLNLISFFLSSFLILSHKLKDDVKDLILRVNIVGLLIALVFAFWLFIVVNDSNIVFDRFSRWRKYFSLFTPFSLFPILYFLERVKFLRFVKFIILFSLLVLSFSLSLANFSRDPREHMNMNEERRRFFLKTGYGVPLSLQRDVTSFLIERIGERKTVFISAPLSIGFPYVLSKGRLSPDYFTCQQIATSTKKFANTFRSKYHAVVFDLSCSAYGFSSEALLRYFEPKNVFEFGEHFVVYILM